MSLKANLDEKPKLDVGAQMKEVISWNGTTSNWKV